MHFRECGGPPATWVRLKWRHAEFPAPYASRDRPMQAARICAHNPGHPLHQPELRLRSGGGIGLCQPQRGQLSANSSPPALPSFAGGGMRTAESPLPGPRQFSCCGASGKGRRNKAHGIAAGTACYLAPPPPAPNSIQVHPHPHPILRDELEGREVPPPSGTPSLCPASMVCNVQ